MISVTLTQVKPGRLRCEATRGGEPTLREVFAVDSARLRDGVAKKLSIDAAAFLRHCLSVTETAPVSFEVNEPSVTSAPVEITVCVRDMFQKANEGTLMTGPIGVVIADALKLQTGLRDPIVEWTDDTAACFLDVDYHHIPDLEHRPSPSRAAFIVARLQPQPVLWFLSRGRGIHALYVSNGVPANTLAAVAGFCFRTIDPTAEYDVVPHSRLCPGEIFPLEPTSDLSAVRRFMLGSVEDRDVDGYLERLGVDRNKAYPHTQCPVEPNDTAGRNPVYFGELGVLCQRCAAKGVMFGSRRPGFFPYSALCGSHEMTDVSRMVENMTHWTHAKVVLDARCRLRGENARLAYDGMLRLRHADDDRLARVMVAGEHLLRGVGEWVTPDRYETLTNIRPTLATLPAVNSPGGKPYAERLDMFDQTVDLSRYGYASIHPLRGMRVFGEFLGNDSGRISLVLPPTNLVSGGLEPFRPKYVEPNRRMNLDEAWGRVEATFPGINRDFLTLLIAARGVAEGQVGMAANLLVVGPTGSGKSSTPHVAAAILGDSCNETVWTKDSTRFRQAYSDAIHRGAFVVVNEIFKEAKRERVANRSAFDVFLTLTPDSLSHKMYVGPVPLGQLPVTIVTDTSVPADVRSDAQLGRRFVYVRLPERLDWEESLVTTGVGVPSNFRAHSIENAEAGNAIASSVIDRFFGSRARPLVDIARELGFDTLEHSDELLDDPDALPELFAAICKAPTETNNPRLKGRGWKTIHFTAETELADYWRSVCDGVNSFEMFASSRKVQETDWSMVADVPKGTRVDVLRHGQAIAVRFRYGETRGQGKYFVNEELLTCEGIRRKKPNENS